MAGGYIGNVSNVDLGSDYYTRNQADATFYKIGDSTGVIHSQRFIGSSSQRSYSLARTPETKNNTQVFINGIYQNKETYNVTGSVLTLSTFPVDGYEIEVIIISSTLYADLDCSAPNIEYTPSSDDGSYVISLEDKLRSITGFVDFSKQKTVISNLYHVTGVQDSVLFVSGFWEQGDGGGGIFFWDNSISKDEHNGGTIIDPDKCESIQHGAMVESYFTPEGPGTGCWLRIYKGTPDVKWFGAKGDDTDDTYSVNHAIAHEQDTIQFTDGIYAVSGVVVEHDKNILLSNNTVIRLKDDSNRHLFEVNGLGLINKVSFHGGTLDGNRTNQSVNRDAIHSEAQLTVIDACNIIRAGNYAVFANNVIHMEHTVITDSKLGVSVLPSTQDVSDQIIISNSSFETNQTGLSINKSSDRIPRYQSVIIENTRISVVENVYNIMIACKSGLRFTGNHLIGGSSCLFRDGAGGVISGNVFENQVKSIEINNYSSLSVSNNHLNGSTNGQIGITHDAINFNNLYSNNHIEGYSVAVAEFVDDDNEFIFANNTCHDAPLIIENSCSYNVNNNKFSGGVVGIEIYGSSCTEQSGSITGNKFKSVGTGIKLQALAGKQIVRVSITNNNFSSVGTVIVHDKNLGNIGDLTVIGNTFVGFGNLLHMPTSDDKPTSLLWKDNIGDMIYIDSPTNLQYDQIIFGEQFTLNDVAGLAINVGTNTHAIGQQFKITYNGSVNPVTLHVANHAVPNSTFEFNSAVRYLVLEWSGRQWENVSHRYASTTHAGIIEIATHAECSTGTSDTLCVPASGLKTILHDEITITDKGWSSEKISNHVTESIETAIDGIPYATTVVSGLIKLTTPDECEDGTNSNKAVTPVGLRGLLHDDDLSNITTWSSVKISDYISNEMGIALREESDSEDECPVLFTNHECCDRITEANISPPHFFYVPSRGSLNSVSFNSLSDQRYKDNISTISGPLNIINQLRGVQFNWKHNNEKSYGVIAQELEKVLPDLVSLSPESGIKTVNYDGLIGFLLEAIKELSKRA